eukprot:TRINITY_DN29798_c0_g1_i1.p1 TRINITY_DN29798_c0_g1~~TRINITY_DN29798_c0_g1_i1.p1  ORF type:complete len:227 (+),score=126.83 TRINITY_DN29798_c0_g1_i1:58-738(+)
MGEPAAKRQKTEAAKEKLALHSYWRSSCSWRVRCALALKGLDYEYVPVNLLKGEQRSEEMKKLNPMGQVPAFVVDGQALSQSLAIMEYIEETHAAGTALLPKDAFARAKVRELCGIIATGIQPIQNLAVIKMIAAEQGDDKKMEWAKHWITVGFEALEAAMEKTAGKYSHGDEVSMADCCLPPQIYNAGRFKVDMSKFPTIARVGKALEEHEAFQKAVPEKMPDAA